MATRRKKAKYKVGDILYLGKSWGMGKYGSAGKKVRVTVPITYEDEFYYDGKKIKGQWKYKTQFIDKKGNQSKGFTVAEKDLRKTKPK